MQGDDRHSADASGAGQTFRLKSDLALGVEGDRIRGRHVLHAGDRAYCALSWADGLAVPEDFEEAERRIAARFASGAPGSAQPAYPTTVYAIRSSAPRLRSRA
jgi:hypothetical protein